MSSYHIPWSPGFSSGAFGVGGRGLHACRQGCVQRPSVLSRPPLPVPPPRPGSSAPCPGPSPSMTSLLSSPGGEEGAPGPGPEPDREARFPERGPGRVPGRGLRARRSGPQEGWGAFRLLKRLLPPQSWDPTQLTSRLAWPGRIWTPWLDGQPGASRGGDSPADGWLWGPSPALPEPLWPCPDPSNLPRPLTQDCAPAP